LKRIVSRRETVWPTRLEIDLLHAALDDDGSKARAAWDRWRLESGGVADAPALGLLPLVEWNLRRLAPGSPAVPGYVEHESIRGLAIAQAAAPVLAALRDAGVSALVLKGFALAHGFYPHPGLRAMRDVDLLVCPADFGRSRAVLERLGWKIAEPEPEVRLRHLHGAAYRKPDGPELDLHTRALAESATPEADAGLFSRAVPIEIAGVAAQTLSPADHLLVVCVHGLRWSTAPAIHWVADAAMILRHPETVDWTALLEEAHARRLEASLGRALRLLAEEFTARVPSSVLERLAAADSPGRRRELAVRMSRPSLAGGLLLHWRQLAQERSDLSFLGRLGRFPSHLREMWNLDHAWEVPAAAIRKSTGRLAGKR
jgi:hypothetical protein